MEKTLRRIVVDPEVTEVTGVSKSTRWRMERAGKFPKAVRLSSGRTGYFEDELLQWQNNLQRADVEPRQMPKSPGRYHASRKSESGNG